MNAKAATVRLYVALVTLVAALFELGAALARLGAVLAQRAAVVVRPRPRALPACPGARPRLRVVASSPPAPAPAPAAPSEVNEEERTRLICTFTRMGFRAPAARAFVDSLGDRVGQEPIKKLVTEGLAALAA
jgi:hypothetical protein